MLWEKCMPKRFYKYIKKPENFTVLNSEKITFKHAKNIFHSYVQLPDIWQEMLRYVRDNHTNYQYVYSLLFPNNYLQNIKYGIQSKIKFAISFDEWQKQKMAEEIGKSPFNFNVPQVVRHPFEQMSIKDNFQVEKVLMHPAEKPINPPKNDDEFRADHIDSSNKENIPPAVDQRFLYAPTMVGIEQFDKKYKLPKVKKTSKSTLEKAEQRKKKTKHLKLRLGEIDEKMKSIRNTNKKK